MLVHLPLTWHAHATPAHFQAAPPSPATLDDPNKEEALRRAATAATNVPVDQQMYPNLQPVDGILPPTRWAT